MGNFTRFAVGAFALPLMLSAAVSQADPIRPDATELRKYLIIGTGNGSQGDDFASVQLSDVELGADQEIVSNGKVDNHNVRSYQGGLDLTGDFVPEDGKNVNNSNNRWNDVDPDSPNDTVGIPDILPGARPIFEGVDWSGNVAVTGNRAKLETSNVDYHANQGIKCNRSAASCVPNPSSTNSFFPDQSNSGSDLAPGNGISEFDPSTLNAELSNWRSFVKGLDADTTITQNIENQSFKDGGNPFVTNLDAVDAAGNNDGIAVIDINVGNKNEFLVNNSDWILETSKDTLVIFRMTNEGSFDFANSSIVLGGGDDDSETITELGAIFFTDELSDTNTLFELSNVILGGIALWDLVDFNPDIDPETGDRTVVNLQNAQGCAQFIGHQVLQSNNRWNRCALGEGTVTQVTEPGTFAILGLGLGGLLFARRRRKQAA